MAGSSARRARNRANAADLKDEKTPIAKAFKRENK